ncbi:uncharacterized protein LOC130014897 [Mercurialis annua]|uniref:uncharacterized protein LOC130014897 n=1 Tax=Mercurialis annua TaxID=3986 RepID=UPI0024AF71E3|nr:uncharacterized protein LOC130014897 [Mercurialis annua]
MKLCVSFILILATELLSVAKNKINETQQPVFFHFRNLIEKKSAAAGVFFHLLPPASSSICCRRSPSSAGLFLPLVSLLRCSSYSLLPELNRCRPPLTGHRTSVLSLLRLFLLSSTHTIFTIHILFSFAVLLFNKNESRPQQDVYEA